MNKGLLWVLVDLNLPKPTGLEGPHHKREFMEFMGGPYKKE